MEKINPAELYAQKKKRVLGELVSETELTTGKSWLSIHTSSKEMLMTYESSGLVVSINGSGTISTDHQHALMAAQVAKHVSAQKGIILNGGRSSGVMKTSSEAAPESTVGIVFSDIEKESNEHGKKVMVHDPQSRIELLATCAPVIVIFRGGLGTLMVLMRSIVHIQNRSFHPDQQPQMLFVSNYWIGLLTTMMNLGAIPKKFLQEIHYFENENQILNKIPIE